MVTKFECDGCGTLVEYEQNYAILQGGTKEKYADLCGICKDAVVSEIATMRQEHDEEEEKEIKSQTLEERQAEVFEMDVKTAESVLKGSGLYIVYKKKARRKSQ